MLLDIIGAIAQVVMILSTAAGLCSSVYCAISSDTQNEKQDNLLPATAHLKTLPAPNPTYSVSILR